MMKNTVKRNGKRLLLGVLCLCLTLPLFFSCSKPPEFSEIRDRFCQLVEASYEINGIFFGEGLPTYERVTDPRETTELYVKEATGEKFYYYELQDGTYGRIIAYRLMLDRSVYVDPESGVKYFYYPIYDKDYGKITVVKSSDGKQEYYLQMTDAPKDGVTADYADEAKGVWGYLLSDFSYNSEYGEHYTYLQVTDHPVGGEVEPVFADEAESIYCYPLKNYVEPVYESYYNDTDPTDYDYVRMESKYHSINQIKAAAEQVYSKEYLASIYDAQFVGTVAADSSVSGLFARYMEYTDDMGNMSLMKSNTYKPLISETRLYHFDTAKIVKPANKNFVTVSVDSYLPSNPDSILNVTVTMVLQDGVWMLDCATY